MKKYKKHYACFSCRKTIKRRLLIDIDRDKAYASNNEKEAKCPDCGKRILSVGLDFASPKKSDKRAWDEAFCCFLEKLEESKLYQIEEQLFWEKVEQKNFENYICSSHYYRLPTELIIGTRRSPKADVKRVILLWKKRANSTQEKINYLKNLKKGKRCF